MRKFEFLNAIKDQNVADRIAQCIDRLLDQEYCRGYDDANMNPSSCQSYKECYE